MTSHVEVDSELPITRMKLVSFAIHRWGQNIVYVQPMHRSPSINSCPQMPHWYPGWKWPKDTTELLCFTQESSSVAGTCLPRLAMPCLGMAKLHHSPSIVACRSSLWHA